MAKGNRTGGKCPKYSKDEEDLIRTFYPKYGSTGLKGCLNRIRLQFGIERTARGLAQKARKLGAKYEGKIKGAFKKGSVPFNKGKKMSEETYAKVSKTFFKAGHEPHNTRKDGDLSFRGSENSHGQYWYIRVSKANWVLLHRYIFEQSRGMKLKKGDVVAFKDGDVQNLNPDNLELVSRQENLARNNPRLHYPEEITQLIRLVNKLNKKIKKLKDGKE